MTMQRQAHCEDLGTELASSIGGFLALELPEPGVAGRGLLDLWVDEDRSALLLSNARSCLAALLRRSFVGRVWLPAYVCPSIVGAAEAAGVPASFYPLDATLSPVADWLANQLQSGDAVVAIDFFGTRPSTPFLQLARARQDVVWIEDRAQAMMPGPDWGEWILYSPRKVVGVPDGGILIGPSRGLQVTPTVRFDGGRALLPTLLRHEDVTNARSEEIYRLYQESESAQRVSEVAMSHLTRRVLTLLDPAPIAERRRANYAFYAESLGDIAFYPDGIGDAVPFAFPIRCDDAGDVATRLWSEGIFAARYWPTLGSPPAAFPAEHRLANQMVALPCDQRYTPRELVRVARAVRSAM